MDRPTVPHRLTLPLDRGGRFDVWRIEPVSDSAATDRAAIVDVPACFAVGPLVLKMASAGHGDARRADEELRTEARWQSSVVHPGIVPAVMVEVEAHPAIVTPLADGSLDTLPPGRCTIDDAAAALRGIAEALAALHHQGIVHGDVTSSNVLVYERRRPSGRIGHTLALSDFGCARRFTPTDPQRVVRGTPGFVAPEVEAGSAAGPEADVYGLGMVGQCWLASFDPASRDERWRTIERWCRRLVAPTPSSRPTAADAAVMLGGRPRTVEFGPKPTQSQALPDEGSDRRASRAWLAPLALVVSACVLGFVMRSPATPRSRAGADPSVASAVTPVCRAGRSWGLLQPGGVGWFDLLGTGCAQRITWSGTQLVVHLLDGRASLRFRLGEPHDRLAFARWNCTGHVRPALYRPGTGEVLRYDRLPTRPGVVGAARPVRIRGLAHEGQPRLDVDDRGCRRFTVVPDVPSG